MSFGENGPSPKQRLAPLDRSLGAPGTRGRASWNRLWAPWGLVGGAGLGLELPNRPILTTRKSRPVHAPHTMWGCQGPMMGVYWPWVCVAGSLRTVRERGKRWRHDICKFCCFFSEFLPADFSPPISGPPWAPTGRSRRDTSWYGSGALQPVGAVHNGRSHVRHRPAICKPSSPSRMTELGTHSAVAAAVHPMGLVVPVL